MEREYLTRPRMLANTVCVAAGFVLNMLLHRGILPANHIGRGTMHTFEFRQSYT